MYIKVSNPLYLRMIFLLTLFISWYKTTTSCQSQTQLPYLKIFDSFEMVALYISSLCCSRFGFRKKSIIGLRS